MRTCLRHFDPNSGNVFRSCFSIKLQSYRKFISFEYIELLLTSESKTLRIVIVYRPPPSTNNGLTPTILFDEFSTFLEQYITIPGSLLMVSDFNFHVDTCDSEYVTTFLQLLDVFNLNQNTNGSTHKDGHTLDHITRSDNDIAQIYPLILLLLYLVTPLFTFTGSSKSQ